MGTAGEQTYRAPGLHVDTDVEPLKRARHLAAELDADLCATGPQADRLLAELSALPPLTVDAIEALCGLTDRVAAAQRIAERTLDRAALAVEERLSVNGSGVAIHPSTVRDRAAAVIAARAALAAAPPPPPPPPPGGAPGGTERPLRAAPAAPGPSLVASFTDEPPTPRRRRRLFGLGRRRDEDDTSESTSLLQQMVATTDQAFSARGAHAGRDDRGLLLSATHERAQEDLRVATRAWHDLAGDASVDDVEAVVRRFDPQHRDAVLVARETVGVRATATLLERAVRRWEEGWEALGFDPPAEPDQAAMDRIAERLARPVVLVADAVDRAPLIVSAAPAAVVVTLERGPS